MGIRIEKVLGYGIDDLRLPYQLEKDSRISLKKLNAFLDQGDTSTKEFLAWCETHKSDIQKLYASETIRPQEGFDDVSFALDLMKPSPKYRPKLLNPSDCFSHSSEGGDPRVLVITPIEHPDWKRRDDVIDYYEAQNLPDPLNPRVQKIPGGIYPYSGTIIRVRPPKDNYKDVTDQVTTDGGKCDNLGPRALSAMSYEMLTGARSNRPPIASGDALRHFQEDWRAPLPVSVVALLLWSGACKDPARLISDLRPMIYTYWS